MSVTSGLQRLSATLAIAVVLAPSPAPAQRKLTKDDVARLLRIAVMTEWVTRECDGSELEGMLLLTARSTLRVADAEDVARFRAGMQKQVQSFKTKAEACRSATDDLKSVQ